MANGETSTGGFLWPDRHFRKPYNLRSLPTYNLELRTYNFVTKAQACVVILIIATLAGCGYHVAGRSDALPKSNIGKILRKELK